MRSRSRCACVKICMLRCNMTPFTIVEVDDLASYEPNTMNIGNLHAHKALTLEQYCQSQPDHVHDPDELLVIVLPQHMCTSCRRTHSMRWHCSVAGHCGRSRGTNHVGSYDDRRLVSGFEVRCSCRGTSRSCQVDPTTLTRSLPPSEYVGESLYYVTNLSVGV